MTDPNITVLIPTSPSPLHPDDAIIRETMESVRLHLPNSRMIVMCDGIRPELAHREGAYREYLQKLYNGKDFDVVWIGEWVHQAGLMKATLPMVLTPLVLWIEHDMPLLPREINWKGLTASVLEGHTNHVRFMLRPQIHPEHMHLMHGCMNVHDCHLVRTSQWSGWVHLASTDFYRQIMARFSEHCRTMIEDYAQGIVQAHPWEASKLTIYYPSEEDSARCYHLDARRGDPKFEWLFTF